MSQRRKIIDPYSFHLPGLEECAYNFQVNLISRVALDQGLSYAWSFTLPWILWPTKHPFNKLPKYFSLKLPKSIFVAYCLLPNHACSNLPLFFSIFKPTLHIALRIISIPTADTFLLTLSGKSFTGLCLNSSAWLLRFSYTVYFPSK